MLLIDFSAVWISNVIALKLPPQEDLLRHVILNTVRSYNVKFSKVYGSPILCCDSRSWRKKYFPEYKYQRRLKQSENKENVEYWNSMYTIVNSIINEIKENFPWYVIKTDGAEGDDCIGALALSTQEFGQNEKILILASDGDYKQLHKFKNIKQWSLIKKKYIKEKEPEKWLFETIIRGQRKDGIPSILSDNDVFVTKTRQKPITKGFVEELWENRHNLDDILLTKKLFNNFERNTNLMAFYKIPQNIKNNIITQYKEYELPSFNKVYSYLIKNRCRNLIDNLNDFKSKGN